MQKNYSSSNVPAFSRQGIIDFDTDMYQTTPESVAIFNELNAISEEIELCRQRNAR